MDKLRALQYFVAAAEGRSFSAAARGLEVSIPAVAKLINALERNLSARLFVRSARGLTLSAEGESYLEACRPLLEQLAAADELLAGSAARPRGTVVVGAWPALSKHCLLPTLPRFHSRYPEIRIDIRDFNEPGDVNADAVDVFLLLGWPNAPHLVHRRIGQPRQLVCAAPDYWAAHGEPQRPKDLERHACLLFRTPTATVLDLWKFDRNGIEESVAVSGWLVSDNSDVLLGMAVAGEGVVRFSEFRLREELDSGRLVQVLGEWDVKDAPHVSLLYRPNSRRIVRVRAFIDFVTEIFRNFDAERRQGIARVFSERPRWYHRPGRASAAASRRQP